MNVIIKKELFEKYVQAMTGYANELAEASDYCTLDEDRESLEIQIKELGDLFLLGRRILRASEHGREIKGQRHSEHDVIAADLQATIDEVAHETIAKELQATIDQVTNKQ